MTVLAIGWLTLPAAAQSFPDAGWAALPCRGHLMDDPYRDETGAFGERDLVGSQDEPAGYRAVDAGFAYFRLRLDHDPMPAGDPRPFAWGILLDRDGDPATYEAQILVNGISSQVELYANTATTLPDDPTDPPDDPPVATWEIGKTARSAGAGSSFGGDPDRFLDVAVPWDELAKVDVGPSSPVAVWLATSSTASSLNGDFVCHDARSEGDPTLSGVDGNGTVLDPDAGGSPTSTGTGATGTPGDTGGTVLDGLEPVLEGGGGSCSTSVGSRWGALLAVLLARRRR